MGREHSEVAERFNVRVEQAERTKEALDGLAGDDEPALVGLP